MLLRPGSTRTSMIESERPEPPSGRTVGAEHERGRGVREQRAAGRQRGAGARVHALVGRIHGAAELPVAVADPEHEDEQDADHRERDDAPDRRPPPRRPGRAPRRRPARPRRLLVGEHDHPGRPRGGAGGADPRARPGGSTGDAGGAPPAPARARSSIGSPASGAPAAIGPERPLGVVPGHGGTLPAPRVALLSHFRAGSYRQPVLTVVPTPLGNLRDITLRALDALAAASVIACEDTRRTRALLSAHEIPAPELVACDERREPHVAERLVARALAGEPVALVSDSGMPLIADPGRLLVARALAAGCQVAVLPGPSAVETALVASGLGRRGVRVPRLGAAGRGRARALPHGCASRRRSRACCSSRRAASTATLADLARLAPEHPIAVARELTKLHEEVAHGSASEVAARGVMERGEICLVLAAAPRADRAAPRAGGARGRARAGRARPAHAQGERARGPPHGRPAARALRRGCRPSPAVLHCPDAAPR